MIPECLAALRGSHKSSIVHAYVFELFREKRKDSLNYRNGVFKKSPSHVLRIISYVLLWGASSSWSG